MPEMEDKEDKEKGIHIILDEDIVLKINSMKLNVSDTYSDVLRRIFDSLPKAKK